jgi:hypothetical protein
MGGVCTALAESATCQLRAPAAAGIRRPDDDNAWGADTTIQLMAHPLYGAVLGIDEEPAPALRVKGQVGANLSFQRGAAGAHVRQDGFSGPDGNYLASQIAAPVAVTGGTWSVGVAPLALLWTTPDGTSAGTGASASALWLPDDTGWRVGLAGRSPVRTGDTDAAWSSNRLPATGSVGLGYAFGLRNVAEPGGWPGKTVGDDPDYLVITGELELVGGAGEATDLWGRTDDRPSLRVRGGVEADVLEQHLRLRGGGYVDPARFGQPAVPHVTAGAGVYLFTWLQGLRWRAAASLDWAPGEPSVGVGVETW